MRLTTFSLLFLFVLIFYNCKKEEEENLEELNACINVDTTEIILGETVFFTSCSENSTRVEWDFGDGNSSAITNPSHIYKKRGEYTVRLTAIDKNNSTKVTDIKIKVGELQVTKVVLTKDLYPGNYKSRYIQVEAPETRIVLYKSQENWVNNNELPYTWNVENDNWILSKDLFANNKYGFVLEVVDYGTWLFWQVNPFEVWPEEKVVLSEYPGEEVGGYGAEIEVYFKFTYK